MASAAEEIAWLLGLLLIVVEVFNADTIRTVHGSSKSKSTKSTSKKYTTDISPVGKRILCSEKEWECLRRNMLWFPESGHERCYKVGEPIAELKCRVEANRTHLQWHKHLLARCVLRPPCPRGEVRSACEGMCVSEDKLRRECSERGAKVVRHHFGGLQCSRCGRMCSTVQQPLQKGRNKGYCVFPELHFQSITKWHTVSHSIRYLPGTRGGPNDRKKSAPTPKSPTEKPDFS